jgi:hypothetical protein
VVDAGSVDRVERGNSHVTFDVASVFKFVFATGGAASTSAGG